MLYWVNVSFTWTNFLWGSFYVHVGKWFNVYDLCMVIGVLTYGNEDTKRQVYM